jgi:uncharacterized protein (TIGR03084 family)
MPTDGTALFAGLLADLTDESAVIDQMVGTLPEPQWSLPTPAAGWSIADQISHLAYFDQTATLAVTDPARFRAEAQELMALGDEFPDRVAERYRDLSGAELLSWFHRARQEFCAAMASTDPRARLPWYGPDMSAASSVTARLMETWAHGQDIADTLGVTRAPSQRLRHIAHLGVRTRDFSFALRGRPRPAEEVRVELTAPDGGIWSWGPERAADRVSGPAVDFCLVAVQRRNLADTTLAVSGPVATEWMSIVQAFAGAPGPGRPPLASGGDTP